MKFRGRLNKVEKTLVSLPATGDATTGKPFRRFWAWCAGLLKRSDLTPDERQGWADHQARLREQAMQSPQMLMLQDLRRERGLPPLTEPPDDVITAIVETKRTPVPTTPDPTKE
jgi:hypothetical protein